MVIKKLFKACVFVGVFVMLIAGCSSIDVRHAEYKKSAEQNIFFSDYVIFEVVKYRGGLTSRGDALARKGTKMTIVKNYFQIRNSIISEPVYKIRYHQPASEGEIGSERWSHFYGLSDQEQSKVKILEVYDEKDSSVEPSIALEIKGENVWEYYDGWVYKMKPIR